MTHAAYIAACIYALPIRPTPPPFHNYLERMSDAELDDRSRIHAFTPYADHRKTAGHYLCATCGGFQASPIHDTAAADRSRKAEERTEDPEEEEHPADCTCRHCEPEPVDEEERYIHED